MKTLRQWRQYEELFPAINQATSTGFGAEGSRVPPELMRLLPDKEISWCHIGRQDTSKLPRKLRIISFKHDHVDAERLIPCTNCGMAPISMDVAKQKLKALGEGSQRAEKKIS